MADNLPAKMTDEDAPPDHVPQPGSADACLTPAQMDDARLVSVVKAVGPPPRFRGRGTFTDEHKLWVIAFLSSIPSPSLAARIIGCSADTLYHHKRNDPEFKARWDQAYNDSMETLMGAAAEEALGIGEQYVVTKEGTLMTIPKERNDKLLAAFMLRETKVRHEHEHTGGVVVMPAPMSEEEWEERVLKQQACYRDNIPGVTPETPITDALINARKPIVIEGTVEVPDNMPRPPDRDVGSVRLRGHDLTRPAVAVDGSSDGIRTEKPELSTPRRTVRSY